MAKIRYAKTDFTEKNMPHSRVQVFFDVIKNRPFLLVSMGALILLFSLPLIAVTVFRNIRVSEAQLITDAAERANTVFSYVNIFNFISIAAWAVVGTGLGGVFAVIRRLVWQQGIFFRHDFFTGVKENAISFAFFFAVGALLNYLVQRTLRATMFDDGFLSQAAAIASIVAAALYAPTISFSLVQSTVYNLELFKKLYNSLLLAMRVAYTSFPVALLNLAPLALLFIPNTVVFGIFLIVLPVFVYPLIALFDTLYCDAVLDKYVNKENFPQIVNKGIYKNADDKDRTCE